VGLPRHPAVAYLFLVRPIQRHTIASVLAVAVVAFFGCSMMASRVLAEDENKAGPCTMALEQSAVCESANQRALEIMRTRNLEAITVVLDVHSGSLVAFAASDPAKLDVTTPLLPLSTVKLMVAASWLDHEQGKTSGSPDGQRLVSDMIVSGNDNAGRRIASALRTSIGAESVLKDLERYGFPFFGTSATPEKDTKFWIEVAPQWRDRLTPALSYHSLSTQAARQDWEDTLSLGEAHFKVTALHVSRFLQAVGNGGLMIPTVSRVEKTNAQTKSDAPSNPRRIMRGSAALKLQAAMRAVVERGTAKSVANVLADTGWQIGGKTGTGPGPNAPGPESDGWFAGLIFDPQGNARFTTATFVKRGGYGGGNAAWISAELARFLIRTNAGRQ
jgi:hypothetical protein